MIYNIHAGHCPNGKGAYGATGFLKESVENRLVKDEVIRLLKQEGHTVYDCTCDTTTTQSGCLKEIVTKCNKHSVHLDISIHFNSGRSDSNGDGKNGGVEILATDFSAVKKAPADRIRSNMKKLGFTDRGNKTASGLYYLNHTKAKALLIEVCFVDDKDDYELYKKVGYRAVAKAIAEGIIGKTILDGIDVGSKVKIKEGAYYGGASYGNKVSPEYIGKYYTVDKLSSNTHGSERVLEARLKELISWVPVEFLTK